MVDSKSTPQNPQRYITPKLSHSLTHSYGNPILPGTKGNLFNQVIKNIHLCKPAHQISNQGLSSPFAFPEIYNLKTNTTILNYIVHDVCYMMDNLSLHDYSA